MLSLNVFAYEVQDVEKNYDLCLELEEDSPDDKVITLSECETRWIPLQEYYTEKGTVEGFYTALEYSDNKRQAEIKSQNAVVKYLDINGVTVTLRKKHWDRFEKTFEQIKNGPTFSGAYTDGRERIATITAWEGLKSSGNVPSFQYHDIKFSVSDKSLITNNSLSKQELSMSPYANASMFGLKPISYEASQQIRMIFPALFTILTIKADKHILKKNKDMYVEDNKLFVDYKYLFQKPDKIFATMGGSRFHMYVRMLNSDLASDADELSLIVYSIMNDLMETDMISSGNARAFYNRSIEKLNIIQIVVGGKNFGLGDFTKVMDEEFNEHYGISKKTAKQEVEKSARDAKKAQQIQERIDSMEPNCRNHYDYDKCMRIQRRIAERMF